MAGASSTCLNDGEKFSALVVDDSALIRNIEQRLLNNYGFKTTAVENGQQAVDLFTAGKSFDAVFMDMEMPVMNGIQATKEIRAMGVKSKIFGVSGSDSKTNIEAFIAAGLDEYFEKPLNFDKMDSIIKRLMNN